MTIILRPDLIGACVIYENYTAPSACAIYENYSMKADTKHWQVLGKTAKGREEIVRILLKNRDLDSSREIDEFFNPPNPSTFDLKSLGIDPEEIAKGIKRVKKAIKLKEKIIVYGDYDTDGICGTAILWETLNALGANVLPYIPRRVEEGYGLSIKGIDNLLSSKPSLVITVDHGITARREIKYAKEKGIDVIITDHHQKPKILPKSCTTVWTDKLSGAGVAWVLARELIKNSQLDNLKIRNYLELVALATIADLLPLQKQNRSLVKFGLLELNQTQRPGLLALFSQAGLTLGKIGIYEVSFIIAPRINASGRIEHALDSLRLLCTNDPKKAKMLAQKLDEINRERQRLTEEAFLHARSLVQKSQRLIFISHHSYNEGVIGLVAGRLTEEFWRPAIIVSEGKIHSKASARSVNGINIIETIRKFEELLVDCGGHPMAAGFTVETTRLAEVKKRLLETAQKEITPEKLEKTLKIDCEVTLDDINWALYEGLLKFEPFGQGNPEPVFLTRNVKIKDVRLVGNDGKHLKLLVEPPQQNSTLFSAIGFGLGNWSQKLKVGEQIDLVYILLVDSWNGEERLQLKIKDLRLF